MDYQSPFDRQPAGPAFIFVTAASLASLLGALDQGHPDGPLMVGVQDVEIQKNSTAPAHVDDTPPSASMGLTVDQKRILRAVRELWGHDIPPQRVQERDRLVNGKLGNSPASTRALREFFNNILPHIEEQAAKAGE